MPRKADVANAANKEWRIENDLVGKQLNANQKRACTAFIETRWAEAQDSPPPPVEPIDPHLKPTGEPIPCTADIETLGTRTVMKTVQKEIETGRNDRGPITVMKNVRESFVERHGLLTTEEAHTLGTQEWKPMGNKAGQYTCIVGGRRFTITPEDYKELCNLQS